jgi:predicted  nucleic acid-binding Zn-ribbon protein
MQTKNKTLSELETELQQHEYDIATLEKKISQHENQIKTILHRANNEKRRIRTHRLCERGAIAESLIPSAETLNNEQVKGLLSVALGTNEARAFLENALVTE